MKLVLVIQFFPPKWLAGAEIATYNIAKYLAKKHDVHVITSLDEGLPRVRRERFGREGKELVKKQFDLNEIVACFEKVYSSCI